MAGHRKFSELTKNFSPERKRWIAAKTAEALAKMDREIHIEPIMLDWSEWHPWLDIKRHAQQGGVVVPNKQSGVYEVKIKGAEDRLAIGKSADLRMRIKQGLVRGKVGHPAGNKIRANENVEDVMVRWAITDRPAAVEEELHMRHEGRFGGLPKYTHFT